LRGPEDTSIGAVRGSDLVASVRMAACGQSLLHPRAVSDLMARARDRARRDPVAGLSRQSLAAGHGDVLPERECWRLLAMVSVGRLALSVRALPVIVPRSTT
jgi:hypothetical protein